MSVSGVLILACSFTPLGTVDCNVSTNIHPLRNCRAVSSTCGAYAVEGGFFAEEAINLLKDFYSKQNERGADQFHSRKVKSLLLTARVLHDLVFLLPMFAMRSMYRKFDLLRCTLAPDGKKRRRKLAKQEE